MIQIYSPNNTTYTKNGDMILAPTDCRVSAELNGSWSISFTHPIDDDNRWTYITENAVVKVPSFNGEQLFRITEVSKSDGGVEAEGRPIFLDSANDCFLVDIRPTNLTGQAALTTILAPNKKYSASSDITTKSTAYYELKNAMEAIASDEDNSFLNRWGGEILYDNYKIIVNSRVGGDYGVQLLYRKNIATDGITETVIMDDVATRIVPKAFNGRMLSTTNKWVDSPLINSYPTVFTRVIEYPEIVLKADVEGMDTEGMTVCANQTALNNALTAAVNKEYETGIDKPTVSIDIDMVLLGNTEEFKDYAKLEKVSLGDTIHCKHSRLGIVTDARIIALEFDCIRDMVSNVTIGEAQPNIMQTLTSAANSIKKAITPSGTVNAGQIEGFINGALAQLRLQNSIAKKQNVRAILFEDLDPDSATFGAMALGTQGFQISRERTADGEDWVWTTFGTAEGFNANYINAGTLNAIDITGSTITGSTLRSSYSNGALGTEISGGTVKSYSLNGQIRGKLQGGGSGQGADVISVTANDGYMAALSVEKGDGFYPMIQYNSSNNTSNINTLYNNSVIKPHIQCAGANGNTSILGVTNGTETVYVQAQGTSQRLILGAPETAGTQVSSVVIDGKAKTTTVYNSLVCSSPVSAPITRSGDVNGATIADKSLASGTAWLNIGSIVIPAGAWLLNVVVSYASNATGRRAINISTSSGGTALSYIWQDTRAPANGSATPCRVSGLITGGRTVYVNGAQNSGSALTATTRYQLVKLGTSSVT